ncbi:isochorismatase family protein [Streptomyces sp. SUK 48]|uniref:isochorismatase family protein n=1 Tax=Streptomyces sp. SUK 48 TaxID=2582831 RepID=UPI00129B9E66|nr:isochorismatase family protein [Streptomyces sp. SUK 48]
MTSSSVLPYSMPDAASLPGGGPSRSIDPSRAVLVVQHMQEYVLRALRETAPVAKLLDNISRLTETARCSGVPVVYVTRVPGSRSAGGEGPGPVFPAPVPLAPPTEADAHAVVDVLRPEAGDTVLTAKRYSAFAGTRLRSRLKELGRDQVLVVGAAAHTDVLLTAADAWMQDPEAFVVADAVADRTADGHTMAVRWLAATSATVTLTESVRAELRGRTADTMAL